MLHKRDIDIVALVKGLHEREHFHYVLISLLAKFPHLYPEMRIINSSVRLTVK